MSSTNILLLPSDHHDEIEKDDELWIQYVSIAADADKQMIDAWMKLVDTILVFDALLIGILSAFTLATGNSSSSQRNPAEVTNDLLVAIYTQLTNSSAPPVDPNSLFQMNPNEQWFSIHSNSLLYPSLAIAIVASLLGTSSKLWLIRYSQTVVSSAASGTPYERAIRRQEIYDGILAWRLKEIIESLPLLMGISIILFALYIHFSILASGDLAFKIGIMFALGLLFILAVSILAAFFPTAPFQSTVSDFIAFIFKIFPHYPLLRISGMVLVSVTSAIMAAYCTITQFSTAFLALLAFPVACVAALASPHPEKKEMNPRMYGLPAWALFSSFAVMGALSLSAWMYTTHNHPTPFYISFSFACALIPVLGYPLIQFSKSAPDTTTARAVTWMLMNSVSQNGTWVLKVARSGSSRVKRAILLENLLPLLSSLITSIPHHHSHAALNPDLVAYVACLARLCDFEPSTGSFWKNLWHNEVAFPRPHFSKDLEEKLKQLRDCPQCPREVQDHARHALDFCDSENRTNSQPVKENPSKRIDV